MFDHVVESKTTDGLFADIACGLMDRNKARKESIDDRVEKCAEVVNASTEQWVIWCHRNEEAEKLVKLIPGAVDVAGADSIEHKEESVNNFLDGTIRVMISKPKILGAGMNLQCCHNTAFVGLSDSWEQYYQAIRRFFRFGQTHEVNVHVISAESEGAVVANIKRKEEQNHQMGLEMVKFVADSMKREIFGATEEKAPYDPIVPIIFPSWLI
jgi:predicted RNA-binding protein with RPS1 domain